MKIYHICKESVFLEIIQKNFEHTENQNFYCTLQKPTSDFYGLIYYKKASYLRDEINKNADIVILHSLCCNPKDLEGIKKVLIWSTWGYDIYSQFQYNRRFLLNIDLYKKQTLSFFYLPGVLFRDFLSKTKDFVTQRFSHKNMSLFYSKVSYIITVLEKEFDLIQSENPSLKFKKFNFKYIDYDKNVPFSVSPYSSKVWIGNSATPENNHLDIIELLGNRNIDTSVCMPVSYGDHEYKKFLKKKLSGYNNILFLDKFMPLAEYEKLQSEYSNFVFGNIRQQAMGNIYNALRKGKRIFLYKDSIIYMELKRLGYKVYSIEEDLSKKTLSQEFPIENSKYNYDLYNKLNDGKKMKNNLKMQLDNISI